MGVCEKERECVDVCVCAYARLFVCVFCSMASSLAFRLYESYVCVCVCDEGERVCVCVCVCVCVRMCV